MAAIGFPACRYMAVLHWGAEKDMSHIHKVPGLKNGQGQNPLSQGYRSHLTLKNDRILTWNKIRTSTAIAPYCSWITINEFKWVEPYFFSPYTPSWHGKRQIYLYVHKIFPPCFQPATVCTVHLYNRVKRGAERSAQVMAYLVLFFTVRPTHRWGFENTLRPSSHGTTPMDEWSVRRRDLCLTVLKTHNRQMSMSSGRFEPAIPASERPQILAFRLRGHWDRFQVTGTFKVLPSGLESLILVYIIIITVVM